MSKKKKKIKLGGSVSIPGPAFFTLQENSRMTKLERLQKDSAEISSFMEKLKAEGNIALAKKVEIKKQFVDNKVKELENIS